MVEGHAIEQADWDKLRSAWNQYAGAVEEWMGAAGDPSSSASAEDVDGLIHSVIAAHNSWSDAFSRVIQATHHH